MAVKTSKNRDLPPKMFRRIRTLKSGKLWIGYYYDGRQEGKRVEIPLGTDFDAAKKKWAELEQTKVVEEDSKTLGWLFTKYQNEIIPKKAPRTQKDNLAELKQLRSAFEDAPIDSVTASHIAQYRDARTAKIRANREMALLSHIYNTAIEWGFAKDNPVAKVRKNKEAGRSYYAYDDVFFSVYKHACQELKDLLMVAYLSGQRPADVHKIRVSHITTDHLLVDQNKTGQKLKIKLNDDKGRTPLGLILDDILSRKKDSSPFLITVNGNEMTYTMRRKRFDIARLNAIDEALANHDKELADRIKEFQFRDTRPKAASDMNDINLASKLLGHSKEQITRMVYIRTGQEVESLNVNLQDNDAETIRNMRKLIKN